MKDYTPIAASSIVWRCVLFLVILFLLLPAAFQPARADTHYFRIKLYPPGAKELCVGQKITLTGAYGLNQDSPITPLTGPIILTWASYGSTDARRILPGTTSGIFQFTYKAEHPGEDAIHADIPGSTSGSPDDANADPIKIKVVEKCKFRYTLFAELDASTAADDFKMDWKYTISAKGGLQSTDPSQPNRLESHPKIEIATQVTEYQAPDCMLITPDVGSGFGFLDVTGELIDDGEKVDIKFSPPQQLEWVYHFIAVCDGENVDLSTFVPVTSDQDPWIEATIPSTGGAQYVTIDLFKEGVSNLRGAGVSAYYIAKVTLERVESQ